MLRQDRLDVSLAEVVAFEKKGFAGGFGEGVSETISEIEAGGMAAFAIIGIALACEESLLFGDRLDGNAGGSEKRVALAEALVAYPAFRNNGSLNKGGGGDSTDRRSADCANVNLESRLTKHNGEYSGRIQDHLGRPFSSYKSSAWSM